MSTMTGTLRRAILSGVVGTMIAAGVGGAARADVASDKPGAILIFPKIVIDTEGVLGPPTDTEIQISNTSNSVIAARCVFINATSACSNNPDIACTPEREAVPSTRRCPRGGTCQSSTWGPPVDFEMRLTKRQPIAWKASEGLPAFPCDPACVGGSNTPPSGNPSGIQPVGNNPFIGELRCVEVSPSDSTPVEGFDPTNNLGGDLKGEVTIVSSEGSAVDARKYNGIAIQAIREVNNHDNTLQIGGDGAEYNPCPSVLLLDNFFDDAVVVTHKGAVSGKVDTDLTVVPCAANYQLNEPGDATLQFLVFNEFEQRFSTSTSLTCFVETPLSDIGTRPGPAGNAQSIFNIGLEGTLTGQTRIRPVEGASSARAVLGVVEEFWSCSSGPRGLCTSAANLQFIPGTLTRPKGDRLILSDLALPPSP